MAVFVNEAFTAANATDVDSLTGWDEHPSYTAGQMLIQTNRAYGNVNGAVLYNTGTPASADYAVEATMYCVSVSGKQGICGRLDTVADTYYELIYVPGTVGWKLSRRVDGSSLQIGNYAQTLTPSTSYTVKLDMLGSDIKVYIDGVLRIAVADTVAPITAKGKAGIVVPTSSGPTAGLHIDAITATDASAPTGTASYVGVGAAALTQANATVNPALPAGLAVDDMMVLVGFERSSSGGFTNPSGWTQIGAFAIVGGKARVCTRFYQAGDTAPAFGITTNSTGGIAQIAAFRGIDKTTAVDVTGTTSGTATVADVGPISGITPSVAGALVLVVGARHRDWTSVATLSGDSLAWNEIAEPDSAGSPLIGLVWDYAVIPGSPVAITDKTFTVTSSGAASWLGFMFAFRPATTIPAPPAGVTKARIGGAFVSKIAKRRAAGAFAIKPLKAIGADHPPEPDGGPGPNIYTLSTVEVASQVLPLTYIAAQSHSIFPPIQTSSAQALSYVLHPPPVGQSGMEMLMWSGDQNVYGASASDLATIRSYGVDGFHIASGRLPGMSPGNFQPIFDAAMTAAANFADAHPEFKCTVGIVLSNIAQTPQSNWTPCGPWFNDSKWDLAIAGFQQVANYVNNSNLAGIAIDGEDYQHVTNGWRAAHDAIGQAPYSEQGVSYSEAQVRAKVKARALSLANAVTAINGVTEIYEYFLYLPGSHREAGQVGGRANVRPGTPQSYDDMVGADWIDGWTSNSQIRFYHIDAAYYKPDRLAGEPNWDSVYAYDKANYDSSPQLRKPNSFHCPFIWITEGPRARGDVVAACTATNSCADRMFTVPEVTNQLQKARQYTEGGRFALYDQGYFSPPSAYQQFASAMQFAST